MSIYDGYLSGLGVETTRRTAESAAKPKSNAERGELEDIRWFEYTKLIDKSNLGKEQFFRMLLMGYKGENDTYNLFRLRATHFNLPNPEGDGEIIRNCAEGGDAAKELPCPFCAMVAKLKTLTNDKDQRIAIGRFKGRAYAYVNAIPLTALGQEVDREKFPRTPHIIKLTESLYDNALAVLEEMGGVVGPDSPLNPAKSLPFFVSVEKTGSEAYNVNYKCGFFAKPTPIGANSEEIAALFDSTYDLSKIVKFPTVEEIEKYREEAAKMYPILKNRILGSATTTAASTPVSDDDAPIAKKSTAVKAPPKVLKKTEAPSFS